MKTEKRRTEGGKEGGREGGRERREGEIERVGGRDGEGERK